ncbi:glucosamine-6-phosphate deaminase [Planctomycetes bacterium K23_9]|uniref:Glucosamine-6-phosphate deaminase n=1 Tax=Stieleria marina TaxID=1930275 RepID=A0A517NVI6_9BACT|nr:Glucosamine-6-phosphate deaminase 1 [Planctomycetes bacterium K23_9]
MPDRPQHHLINGIDLQAFAVAADANHSVATEIASLIRQRQADGRQCVLGLATGSTPLGVYAELIGMHRDEGLSFANVVTFNLDEYFPMRPDAPQSYHRFMNENLVDHIDIDPANVHIPYGLLSTGAVDEFCHNYEQLIDDSGGIDLQLLGIGRTGHIGFNEPGSDRSSLTRLVQLNSVTRVDAASDFAGVDNVPQWAITMGVQTILDSRRIRLLAFGKHKAPIVARAAAGKQSDSVPATFLQNHVDVRYLLDSDAASELPG